MFPAKFEYVRAESVDHAVTLLQESEGEGKLIAGGHSLLPMMKLRLAQPKLLIDIGRLQELSFIRREGDDLVIGALATYRDLQFSDEVKRTLPLLAEVAGIIADPMVRARGTLAGSLAHADPAGDMPAVVLALGGSIRAVGPEGPKTFDVDEFFVDILTTQLGEHDVVTEVRLKVPGARTGAAYQKFDQPASHYALTGVCAVVTLASEGGSIEQARVAITGVASKAYRPTVVEQALAGCSLEEAALKEAVRSAADGVDVQGDIHASSEYRAHLSRVLARRAVVDAAARAKG